MLFVARCVPVTTQGDLDKSKAHLLKALQLDPDAVQCQRDLREVKTLQGHHTRGNDAFTVRAHCLAPLPPRRPRPVTLPSPPPTLPPWVGVQHRARPTCGVLVGFACNLRVFQAGRYREAIAAYTDAMAVDPSNVSYTAKLCNNRAAAYIK